MLVCLDVQVLPLLGQMPFCYTLLLRYRKFPSQPRYPVGLMFASGAHVQNETKCMGLFGLCRLIRLTPPAYWKVDVAQPAVTTI